MNQERSNAPDAPTMAAEIDFRRVLDAFGDAVIASDIHQTIVYANAAAERLLGWGPGELLGRPLITVMPERLHRAHDQGFRRYVSTKIPRLIGRPVRVPARRKDGVEIEVELSLNHYPVAGGKDLFIGSLRDLRDRVELERQHGIAVSLRAVVKSASTLTAGLDLDRVLTTVVHALTNDFQAALARVWLYHAPSDILRLEANAGIATPLSTQPEVLVHVGSSASRVAQAAHRRDPVVDNDLAAAATPEGDWARDAGIASVAVFPLMVAGELRGVLAGYFRTHLEEEVVDVLGTFAAMVATALNDVALFAREQIARAEAEVARTHAQASESRYRFLAEAIPQLVWTSDPDGVVDYVNQRWVELTGVPAESLLGLGWISAVHPAHREMCLEKLREARERGGELEIEFLLRASDGTFRWQLAHSQPFRGADGTIQKWFGTSTDIDHRKRMEEAQHFLTEATSIFVTSLDVDVILSKVADLAVRTIADGCIFDIVEPDGHLRRIVAVDADPAKAPLMESVKGLDLQGLNTPPQRLLLLEHGTLIPLLNSETIGMLARDEAHRALMERIGPRSAIVLPLRARGRLMGLVWVYTSGSGRRYGSEDMALVEDFAARAALAIDNARLFAEAQAAVRLRDEFLSIASHELKTPLTPLKLQVARLRRDAQKPEDKAKLDVIDRQVDRLTKLVSQLLDVSRITGGSLRLEPETLDLSAVVRTSLAELDDELKRSGSTVQLHLQSPAYGVWDRLRLEQVVHNLLSNAIKYGQGRPLEVLLSTNGEVATLIVRDHGIGIEPRHQERIFDRFERAVSSRHFGGFGLGLWIVRQIVEASRGRISVESTPGYGSTFVVELPCAPVQGGLAPPSRGESAS